MKIIPFLGALVLVSACGDTVQSTSGAAYLDSYHRAAGNGKPLAEEVVKAASVEPVLTLPARIGLARIVGGRITAIPVEEVDIFATLASKHGDLGEVVAISPLVAEMAAAGQVDAPNWRGGRSVAHVMKVVQLGAARQHLDAVLVYEVGVRAKKTNTPFAVMDLTVIGGALLPTRDLTVQGVARALLMDVRNGYPYGTASADADLSRFSTSFGSDAALARARDAAVAEVVANLAPKLDDMLTRLKPTLRRKG